MHSARGLLSDQTVIDVLAAEELFSELWRAGEEFGGHIHLARDRRTICHVTGQVKGVSNFEGMLRVPDVILFSGELFGLNLILFDLTHIFLDLRVDSDVELTLLAHFVKY